MNVMRKPASASLFCWLSAAGFFLLAGTTGAASLSGEQRVWHRVTLTFDGPSSSETADPNPFLDYRLNVTFSKSTTTLTVPGYFAGDGTGGASGDQWRVHFSPPEAGNWTWSASFRQGEDVAVNDSPTAGTAASFDGESGQFSVSGSDKSAPDFRAASRGLVQNRGGHYLTFPNGQPWIKGGPDIPENFLGYEGFDNTPNAGHSFSAHESDWRSDDPDWGNGDGRAIIGALNYIADRGANTIYFLPMNIGGDGRDTFPTIGEQNKTRYDLSKLIQWEMVFAHAQARGIWLHFVLAETESANENYHDNGQLGPQRRLFYRMLIARFGHHNGIQFNLGEENDYGTNRLREFAAYLKQTDPYDHPVTTHTKSNQYNQFYEPLLGNGDFDITSFQGGNSRNSMYNLIRDWRGQSMAAGVPWAISFDEPQKIENDADDVSNGYPHGRRDKMWPAYMGGAAGFEWYVQQDGGGHSFDQAIDDFSEMDVALRWAGYAVSFFESLPLQNMVPVPGLADSGSGGTSYVLAAPGLTYVVFNDRNGEDWTLDLSEAPGVFEVSWFDPRNGGALQTGTQTGGIAGGQEVNLGSAPYAVNNDWAALVTRVDGGNLSPSVQILAPASNAQFDVPATVQVTVQAVDADGTVERVALRVNDVSQGDLTDSPFSWTLADLTVGSYDLIAEVEDDDGAITQSPTTTIVVTEPGAGPQVVGATLVNAASNTDIMDLSDGARIALTDAPAFNVRAEVSPEVASVNFSLTGVESRTHTENVAPFTLWGDNGGDYNEWIPALGTHTLTLTPRDASGAAGSNMVIEFQVEVDAVSEGVFANGFEAD
ncbi:MAG: DUF5060 domain-containing protein [Pseudomonadota bacterium]